MQTVVELRAGGFPDRVRAREGYHLRGVEALLLERFEENRHFSVGRHQIGSDLGFVRDFPVAAAGGDRPGLAAGEDDGVAGGELEHVGAGDDAGAGVFDGFLRSVDGFEVPEPGVDRAILLDGPGAVQQQGRIASADETVMVS